jgi:hypothetical protein
VAALSAVLPSDEVVIVLSEQTDEEDQALATAVPGIDLVVRSDSVQPRKTPDILPGGGLLLGSGGRGKELGVLSISLTPGATAWTDDGATAGFASRRETAQERVRDLGQRLAAAPEGKERDRIQRQLEFWQGKLATAEADMARANAVGGPANHAHNELRALGADVGEHEPTWARVQAVKEQLTGEPAQPLPSAAPAIEAAPPLPTASAPYEGPFVGTEACVGCHAAEASQWASTRHASAWTALVAASRQYDTDCWKCHSTGAFAPDGPTDPRALAGLESVGCEACHGAGQAHLANPTKVHMVANPPTSQCLVCHDKKVDDGRFDEASYRPRVVHRAR